jgi:hypothetical protein
MEKYKGPLRPGLTTSQLKDVLERAGCYEFHYPEGTFDAAAKELADSIDAEILKEILEGK